jgi:hypothetical protein
LVEPPFTSEKVTYCALVELLVVDVTWVAVEALPVNGPVNDAAVMLPVLVRMFVDGTYDSDVACVPSAVAVPPVAVLVNRRRCPRDVVVLLTATPDPTPAGPRGTTSDNTGAAGSVTSIVAEQVG